MNRLFAEVDGKPAMVTPGARQPRLAIDLPGKDGARTLVVRVDQGLRGHDFTQFWQAYEDMVRKARATSSPRTTTPAPRSR